MAGVPDYGLLQNLPQLQQPNYVGGLLSGLQAAQQAEAQKKAGLLQALQMKKAEAEMAYMPKQQQMEEEAHKARLAMNALNMQATKQGMGTTALQQKQMQQQIAQNNADMRLKQLQTVNSLTGHIAALPEDKREKAYSDTLAYAKNMGIDVSGAPQKYDQAFIDNAYMQSGRALEEAKQQAALAKIPVVQVEGPDGKPVYVRQDQATGMNAYDATTAKNNLATNQQLNKLQAAAASQAVIGTEMKELTAGFVKAIDQIPGGTGPGRSTIAKLSNAGQEAQKYSTNLVQKYLPLLKGALSDNDIKFLQSGTLTLDNSIDTNKKIAKVINAGATRMEEKPKFYQALKNKGVDSATAETLWSIYVGENPILNLNSGNPNKITAGDWKKYTSPDYINKFIAGELEPATEKNPTPSNLLNSGGGINKSAWIQAAKDKNPGYTDAQLNAIYDEKYGK